MSNRRIKKLVIFGAAEQAEISHYYFRNDSPYKVEGFVIDDEFIKDSSFLGLPVIPWSMAGKIFPPSEFDCFVALGYSKVNMARKEIYEKVKLAGYHCPSYISKQAVTFGNLVLGDNCLILENNTVQPFVQIGSNTTIWSGNHLGHHTKIGNHVFISSHVVVSGGVTIEDQCFIGVNATIRDHITLGKATVVGAGSLVMKDTNPFSVYIPTPTLAISSTSQKIKKI
jgi:sugar O-acyltransferase (sialic acid O-acetyltransferase NeuD family)